MKIIKILGIVLASIIGLVLILGLFAKKDVKVERSVLIPSTNKEVIFKNLAMYDEFLKWNPWSSKDPNQKLTFSGEQGMVGSSYTRDGNKEVGKGSMAHSA